ncbi:MAG: hypothetical protein Roseis2KO_32910 [Roseivirga sp.]
MPENDLSNIDWHNLLRVNPEEVLEWFDEVGIRQPNENTTIRFYKIRCSNGKPDYEGLINFFLGQITKYVLDQRDIDEITEDGDNPHEQALKYFGDVDPISDGKYGELILYILVEGILRIPLVVHKIGHIYNDNDQVKGSDGLFVGNLGEEIGLLVGESKMRNSWSDCLTDAIGSIERYLNEDDLLQRELFVAKKHLSRDLSNLGPEALDNLYEAFRTKQEAFNQFSIKHPVLLIYRENGIMRLLESGQDDVEDPIIEVVTNSIDRKQRSIENGIEDHQQDCFDFFLLPTDNVNAFRELCYKVFHGGRDYERG